MLIIQTIKVAASNKKINNKCLKYNKFFTCQESNALDVLVSGVNIKLHFYEIVP